MDTKRREVVRQTVNGIPGADPPVEINSSLNAL